MIYEVVYPEYERYREKALQAQELFNKLLLEEEELFVKTQPNAIRYDKETVQGGKDSNKLEDYVIKKEKKKIDKRKAFLRDYLKDRLYLLELKEAELRKSKAKEDIIYSKKFLDHIEPEEIAKSLNYSVSQVYRVIKEIKRYNTQKAKKK